METQKMELIENGTDNCWGIEEALRQEIAYELGPERWSYNVSPLLIST